MPAAGPPWTTPGSKQELEAQVPRGRMGFMYTNSGALVTEDDDISQINIEDIAHSLSMQCRFGGHCSRFYSVAEHSVFVSHIVQPENALEALLHDSSEGYVTDLPTPIKKMCPDFETLEHKFYAKICRKFGIPFDMTLEVKIADRIALYNEARYLTKIPLHLLCDNNFEHASLSRPFSPSCYAPEAAYSLFINRFNELTGRGPEFIIGNLPSPYTPTFHR